MPFEKSLQSGWTRGIVISLIVAVILYVGQSLFIPLAIAVLLCFILAPLVDRFERLRLGRVFSVVSVAALATLVGAIFAWVIVAQVLDFGEQLPEYKSTLIGRIRELQQWVKPSSETSSAIAEIREQITSSKEQSNNEIHSEGLDAASASVDSAGKGRNLATRSEQVDAVTVDAVKVDVVDNAPTIIQQLSGWLGPALLPLANAALIVLLTIFILLEREEFRGRLVQLFASSNLPIATQALNDATARIYKWLRTMCLINAIYGVVVAVGLYAIDLPNPLLWGLAGFAFRFLPYIGPWLAAIFPFLLSMAVFDGWLKPLVLIAFLGMLELSVNTVFEPWLFGKSVGLSSLGIILAVLFWGWLWGTAGILLAIPITLWLVVLGRHIPQFNFFAVLLGDLNEMPSYHNLYQRLLAFNGEQANAIIDKQLQTMPLSNSFEQVLVPLLLRTELDRRAEAITDEQFEFIHDTIENAVEGASDAIPTPESKKGDDQEVSQEPADHSLGDRSILVVPISNRGDEIAAKVLTKSAAGLSDVQCTLVSTALLANEIIDRAMQNRFDAVVVAGLSSFTSSKARLIVKRLRQTLPNLPVISVILTAAEDQSPRSKSVDQPHQIFKHIDDTLKAIMALPVHQPVTEKDSAILRVDDKSRPTPAAVVVSSH